MHISVMSVANSIMNSQSSHSTTGTYQDVYFSNSGVASGKFARSRSDSKTHLTYYSTSQGYGRSFSGSQHFGSSHIAIMYGSLSGKDVSCT